MYYVATVHAYDVMGEIQVGGKVRLYEGSLADGSRIAFECTTTFQGTGESDPRRWLEDALVGLLEAM